jgi:hypothetical protein
MFIVELFNDDQGFHFYERHLRYDASATTLADAMKEAHQARPNWDIAQVCRPFADCKLPQPVYDYMNGCMFDEGLVNNPASTWADLMRPADNQAVDQGVAI